MYLSICPCKKHKPAVDESLAHAKQTSFFIIWLFLHPANGFTDITRTYSTCNNHLPVMCKRYPHNLRRRNMMLTNVLLLYSARCYCLLDCLEWKNRSVSPLTDNAPPDLCQRANAACAESNVDTRCARTAQFVLLNPILNGFL